MRAFPGLRMAAGVRLARFRWRKTPDTLVSFTGALSRARTALLIMPLKRREFLPALGVIELLRERIPERGVTILSDDHGREAMRALPFGHFIHLLEEDLTPLYLPRQPMLNRVLQQKFDIAIDLNLDLILPSAYICRASDARVRVGFAREGSDPFYNLQIQPDRTLPRKHLYDRMAKFLQMF
ncbi:MAG: hypothetical protein WB626_08340 [Bacteroidota bacterium]